ncbi:SET domain-containing protein-lysine N-methyltransferase [Candidatus Woesearchaeota archaeon]|nr:SET domain-containing protein-lysine N-methyltransferase [Candidatus Woesearchaeota archaeon]
MKSYLSPKTEIKESKIEGRGLFAIKPIKKGEVIGIKWGHIINLKKLNEILNEIGDTYFQINDDFFIAPISKNEIKDSMMFLNHSCNPNAGIEGNIVFVAMRDINEGEEINIDYAMSDSLEYELKCNCGNKNCRKIISGKDWMRKDLQKRYNGYFSSYLQKKIKA